jgi:hypothetical protein
MTPIFSANHDSFPQFLMMRFKHGKFYTNSAFTTGFTQTETAVILAAKVCG